MAVPRPRIVHVIPCDGIGGVEAAARSMLARPDGDDGFYLLPIAGAPLMRTAQVIESRFSSANDPRAHMAAVRTILKLRPDVLICSLWRSVPVCALVRLLRPRTRLVMFLHLDRPMHLPDRILTRAGLSSADEIWSDSAQTLAARPLPPGVPTRVVSFVLDRLAPVARHEPAPRFVCWARIAPQKGFERAVALIALLAARGIGARFEIHGPDGGALSALRAQVVDLGLGDRVRFPGPVDRGEIAAVAARNSFFLQLSRFEGMAMGVVEAMQLGLVPVVTPVGQMARYVDTDTGLLVDPDDLPAAADRLAALLADPVGYRRLRDGAIAYWRTAPLYANHILDYARDLAASAR